MLSPEENQDLFRRCFEALEPGRPPGDAGLHSGADKTAPKQAALFALNMLVGTPAGSTYSYDEYTRVDARRRDSRRSAKSICRDHRA
jgi:hypothetical protein